MEHPWLIEIAWAAGFFDGDGWIGIYRPKRAVKYPSQALPHLQLTFTQADRQVLDRFRNAVGVGKVYGPYGPYKQPRSPMWVYRAEWLQAQAVAAMLWKFLSPVKRRQTAEALRAHHEVHRKGQRKIPRLRTHCGAGHELTPENTRGRMTGGYAGRVCRECNRQKVKKWREAHRDYWKVRQKRKMVAALLES